MANYTRLSQFTTEELRGANQLAPVRVVSAQTIPSGIYFSMRIDLSVIDPTQVEGILNVTAANLEVVAQRQDVGGVYYAQDVNAAQQLVDVIYVTVLSTSGNSSEQAEFMLDEVVLLGLGDAAKNLLTPTDPPVSIPGIRERLDAMEATAEPAPV